MNELQPQNLFGTKRNILLRRAFECFHVVNAAEIIFLPVTDEREFVAAVGLQSTHGIDSRLTGLYYRRGVVL